LLNQYVAYRTPQSPLTTTASVLRQVWNAYIMRNVDRFPGRKYEKQTKYQILAMTFSTLILQSEEVHIENWNLFSYFKIAFWVDVRRINTI